jgi:hypothetical protein
MTWQITLSHHPQPWVLVSGFAGKHFVTTYQPDQTDTYWIWKRYYFPESAVMTVVGDPFESGTIYASGAIGELALSGEVRMGERVLSTRDW